MNTHAFHENASRSVGDGRQGGVAGTLFTPKACAQTYTYTCRPSLLWPCSTQTGRTSLSPHIQSIHPASDPVRTDCAVLSFRPHLHYLSNVAFFNQLGMASPPLYQQCCLP
eukprot:1143363-Pelagomonas_calceolata.AAC.6